MKFYSYNKENKYFVVYYKINKKQKVIVAVIIFLLLFILNKTIFNFKVKLIIGIHGAIIKFLNISYEIVRKKYGYYIAADIFLRLKKLVVAHDWI